MQASALAHEVAGNRMGAAQSMDAPLGLQRHLTVPLFATSAVTGSGIPLLHAFLASLRSTAQPATSALVRQCLLARQAVARSSPVASLEPLCTYMCHEFSTDPIDRSRDITCTVLCILIQLEQEEGSMCFGTETISLLGWRSMHEHSTAQMLCKLLRALWE